MFYSITDMCIYTKHIRVLPIHYSPFFAGGQILLPLDITRVAVFVLNRQLHIYCIDMRVVPLFKLSARREPRVFPRR